MGFVVIFIFIFVIVFVIVYSWLMCFGFKVWFCNCGVEGFDKDWGIGLIGLL